MKLTILLSSLILFISSSCFGQDNVEFYQKHAEHFQKNDSKSLGLEGSREEILRGFCKECDSYYIQIQLFIKVKKYEHTVVNGHKFEDSLEVERLRKLRNSVCKKHVEYLTELTKFDDKYKKELQFYEHKYLVFLK